MTIIKIKCYQQLEEKRKLLIGNATLSIILRRFYMNEIKTGYFCLNKLTVPIKQATFL